MDVVEIFENRYTTKVYDGSAVLDGGLLSALRRVLHLSPSAINSQPWQFVFVEDSGVRSDLAGVSRFNDQKVLDCSCVVVLRRYSSVAAWEGWMEANLAPAAQDYYRGNVRPLGESAVLAWFDRQVYIALGVLLSSCAMLGIHSTPMEGIDTVGYDAVLGDDCYQTVVAVALGVASVDDFNALSVKPKSRRPVDEVVVVR